MQDTQTDFPMFHHPSNKGLVYLDSTATSFKPQSVIDVMNAYYQEYCSNVFRGIYRLSERATEEYEGAREKVARFIGGKPNEIIFVRNTSEAINLVAYGWGRMNVQKGDGLVTTIVEHHSNFVPWQELAFENGAKLHVLGITETGELAIDDKEFHKIISHSKLVALTHVSNVLGTINPVKAITAKIKKINPRCLVLVDGAQSVPHMKVDVADLGVDFYAFSGHKMFGPTGIGVLWGRYELLNHMAPFMFGGDMISEVTLEKTTFKEPPHKFEAGTPAIAEAIGLGAAVDYLSKLGMDAVRAHEIEITSYAMKKLLTIPNLTVYGPTDAQQRGGVVAFTLTDSFDKIIHPHDVADMLAHRNICIRAGHHCAMPLHRFLGVNGTCRASFYVYSTKDDVDRLVDGLKEVRSTFSR